MDKNANERVTYISTFKELIICLDNEPVKSFHPDDQDEATIFQLKLKKLVRDGEI